MTTLFAPPDLLSAWSVAVDGSDPDEYLARGTHLRIFAGLGGTFPVLPFAVFPARLRGTEARLHFTDDGGRPVGVGDVGGFHELDLTPEYGDDEVRRTIRAEVHPQDPAALRVGLLDSHGRRLVARNAPRFLFSAPTLSRFRLIGDLGGLEFTWSRLSIEEAMFQDEPRAAAVVGLPIEGRHEWYVGLHDHESGLDRALRGAPTRLNAMDRPDGVYPAVFPSSERARVEAMLGSTSFGGGLDALVEALVDDAAALPWRQLHREALNDRDQRADIPRLAALQLAALDPGLGRFLGFAEHVDDLPDLEHGDGWEALVVVGVLAIDPALGTRLPHLRDYLDHPDPGEAQLIDALVRAFADVTQRDITAEVIDLVQRLQSRGLLIRAMAAATAPVPPWLPPTLDAPTLVDHRWHPSDGQTPSSLYRVTFAFPDPPLAAMAAVGLDLGGGFVSRHERVEPDDPVTPRAAPRILGHEAEAATRTRASLVPGASVALRRAALVSDENLPAEAGPLSYRFRASDVFGRFGEPVETTVEPPPRPSPPPPVIRYRLELPEGLAAVPPTGPLSPGSLHVTLAIPETFPADPFPPEDAARVGESVVVPRIDELAAGSLPIATATVTLDGVDSEDSPMGATVAGFADVAIALDALDPQDHREYTLNVSFRDRGGAESSATVRVPVTDRRPLIPLRTGVGLFWTSDPGPAPEVQLQLEWRGAARAQYRVYLTDAAGLGLTASDVAEPGAPDVAPSRGRVGEVGANRVLAGAHIPKTQFRLLPETVRADDTGRAVLDTRLPRSLETVQFLRIVPLSNEGAEAPFDSCGIVPVAVPESRRPQPPRLDGIVDGATGVASLTVTADTFDFATLRRDEPGLFGLPGLHEQGFPPMFRIRRAVGAVSASVYGRVVASGRLHRVASPADGAPLVFVGDAPDGTESPLEPFVPYVYWAEVRLPPERRLPAASTPIAGGVTAVDPAGAADRHRPFSPASAPRTLMRLPLNAPAAPDVAQIIVARDLPSADGTVPLVIAVGDAPHAHARAAGPYRLAVWTQWPGQSIRPPVSAAGAPFDGTWPTIERDSAAITAAAPEPPVGGDALLTLHIAYVDPVGRLGDILTFLI